MLRNPYLDLARLAVALAIATTLAACSTHGYRPPQVSITQLEAFTRLAKEPDCTMPVLPIEHGARGLLLRQ